MEQQPKVEEIVDEETKNYTNNLIEEDKDAILIKLLEGMTWINKTNVATKLAIKENNKKEEKTNKGLVPKEFHSYMDIFSEEKAHWFPEPWPWDHKIEMKKGFELKSFKNYNLTPAEQIELDKFLGEKIHKTISIANGFSIFLCQQEGWKTSTLPWLLVLNDWTIKNSYPLPSILEIMDKLKGTKYFTKLDMHWGYNNIRIRKGDEWKVVFKMNKGLFEPTVMFFGMCNSLAMSQSMMDDQWLKENWWLFTWMTSLYLLGQRKNLHRSQQWYWRNYRRTTYSSKPRNASSTW